MYCISVSYITAGVEIRKKLAFTSRQRERIIKKITAEKDISQCVLLCTCNRTEVFFDGGRKAFRLVMSVLSESGGFGADELAPYVMSYVDSGAVTHLFRLAAGLDSMVMGEDEIFRQLKEAYAEAKAAGAAGGEFNMTFQAAFAAAKKIKTETALSASALSIATLAANEAANFAPEANVLIIGSTGKTGMTVMKNLISHKKVRVTAASRSHNADFELVAKAENICTVSYCDRYDYVDEADCIISATSSPHYTITGRELKKHIKTAKSRLFIDLAVPPDFDDAAALTEGARLVGIDYFQSLARENNLRRANSAETAAEIIAAETDALKKELIFRRFRGNLRTLEGMTAETLIYRLKSVLTADELEKILKAAGGE